MSRRAGPPFTSSAAPVRCAAATMAWRSSSMGGRLPIMRADRCPIMRKVGSSMAVEECQTETPHARTASRSHPTASPSDPTATRRDRAAPPRDRTAIPTQLNRPRPGKTRPRLRVGSRRDRTAIQNNPTPTRRDPTTTPRRQTSSPTRLFYFVTVPRGDDDAGRSCRGLFVRSQRTETGADTGQGRRPGASRRETGSQEFGLGAGTLGRFESAQKLPLCGTSSATSRSQGGRASRAGDAELARVTREYDEQIARDGRTTRAQATSRVHP
jgi:hypothetical protein